MSILGWGEETAPGSVRAGVIAASLLVMASFGMSIGLANEPITTAETIETAAAR